MNKNKQSLFFVYLIFSFIVINNIHALVPIVEDPAFCNEKKKINIIKHSPKKKGTSTSFSSKKEKVSEGSFIKNFFVNPKETGALVASSKGLAKKMVVGVKDHLKILEQESLFNKENLDSFPEPNYKVLELGVGSGVFTKEIIRSGIPITSIFLVESQGRFVKVLRKKFPQATIMKGYAQSLLKEHPAFEKKFPVVISGFL
jgi:phospholipid N-methyltransferase